MKKWYALYRDGEIVEVKPIYGEPTMDKFTAGGLYDAKYEIKEVAIVVFCKTPANDNI